MFKSKCLMHCPEGTFPRHSNRLGLDRLEFKRNRLVMIINFFTDALAGMKVTARCT